MKKAIAPPSTSTSEPKVNLRDMAPGEEGMDRPRSWHEITDRDMSSKPCTRRWDQREARRWAEEEQRECENGGMVNFLISPEIMRQMSGIQRDIHPKCSGWYEEEPKTRAEELKRKENL